ncbi:hypothetical protein IQ218_13860 [Synechocystis salina LEGE 06099]|uniref:hypothetical protein n=1 Tax=Synechocystis salina TaxID=945780 RepID=UPI001882A1F3|nr:hypothetical protein [Synechocystis salina]MBE9204325.1 hypothetical protein [Synechocystis salina LEGE 06099]
MNLHYSLFRCQLPHGQVAIINLDQISQVRIEVDPSTRGVSVSLLNGSTIGLTLTEGERLIQALSVHQTAKYASYHAGEFIPNGIPSFPLIKNALMIDTYLADAAHNAHIGGGNDESLD